MTRNRKLPEIQTVWAPEHEDLARNKAAHASARNYNLRAALPIGRALLSTEEGAPKRSAYILEHYRLGRRVYPTPYTQLSKENAVSWSQLPANTYSHGTLYHVRHPACYIYDCKVCKVPNNLYHLVWGRQGSTAIQPTVRRTRGQWESRLTIRDPGGQIELIDRARRAGKDHGLLD